MAQILSAEAMLRAYENDFHIIEANIQMKLGYFPPKPPKKGCCDFDRTLLCPGKRYGVPGFVIPNQCVVTPVAYFRTREELNDFLTDSEKSLLRELKVSGATVIGSMHVFLTVSPEHMCFKISLAIPFLKEKRHERRRHQ